MSEATENSLESSLRQLKCHFTWDLIGERSLDEFEDRVLHKDEFQNSEFKATMLNISAYIKHRRGQNEAALQCLKQAEEIIKQEHAGQAKIRSLVTWGNYAWIYYHLGQLEDAQTYVDKVKQVCAEFSSPYRIESPELDGEEGWARLKSTIKRNERAKVCFEKALEKKPKNPEFTSGWAIACSRLDHWPPSQDPTDPLRKAIRLNPDNQYIKTLLALKLQRVKDKDTGDEGERLVEEALKEAPHATDVLRSAARFYRNKCAWDETIKQLRKALEIMPHNPYLHYQIGSCYRSQVLQLLETGEKEIYEEREKLLKQIELAVRHLKEASENSGNFSCIYSTMASLYAIAGQYTKAGYYEEAECYFQKEFSQELTPVAKQALHLRYGNFQLYQMKCADKAIHHFMEGVKINVESKERAKMKVKLQKIAKNRLSRNEADSEALDLLAFLRELNGETQEDKDLKRDLASKLHCFSISRLDVE
ncbi:PREDICTED: interferon-induced protein with tetratricopeptide repeats 2 [Chinchilla lanigera]|uniref:Interferon induced protein with tetratricopeptide repeats 2 n=1 Tax=Chinchilla lanigera TaxID=34839 RepID=A0A8C2YPJ6_CHILA|nr:PREDICTED: interferon-induced protein with tetratricopeptide repeats 2 [Chinchilla lanigera]